MKNFILVLIPLFFIFSCSDKLTESNAKKIIENCLEKEDKKNTIEVKIGVDVVSIDTLKYKKLANDGYLLFSKNPKKPFQWGLSYTVKLTEKAKQFIQHTEENYAVVVVSTPKVEKVNYVKEIPAFGGAEAKVEFKNKDITPFSILSNDQKEFEIKSVVFDKTSDGWKYCD